jgi:hypothetical protein
MGVYIVFYYNAFIGVYESAELAEEVCKKLHGAPHRCKEWLPKRDGHGGKDCKNCRISFSHHTVSDKA